MNLEILLFTLLLQWVATNTEETDKSESNKNFIRNILEHYSLHYPIIYDYDTKTKLYPPSHDSSEDFAHVHYHHHINGERHHTPQNVNDKEMKENDFLTAKENSDQSDGSPQSDGSAHVHYHHHVYGERHHTPQEEKEAEMKEKNFLTAEEKSDKNDGSLQSDGSAHVHYHHHVYGERHHTENEVEMKEKSFLTAEEKSRRIAESTRRIIEQIKREIKSLKDKLQKFGNKHNSSSPELKH